MPVLLILIGALLPLAMAPGLAFHYDATPKTVLLCLAAVAACARDTGAELRALRSRASGRLLIVLAIASTAWFCVAAAFSSRPSISFFGSAWREFGAVTVAALCLLTVLVTAYLCENRGRIALFLRAVTVAGLLVSIYGIAQYFDIDPFQSAKGYHALDGDAVIVRPPGTFGHADYFGWWLAIEFFCALAVVRGGWRFLGIPAAVLTLAAVVLTGTRSAMIAIVVGGIALFFLRGAKVRPHLRLRPLLIGVCMIAGLALFVMSPAGTRVRSRVAWMAHEPAGGARPLLWRDSLRMAAAKPLTGYGPETFSSAFGQWESDELARLYPDFHHESPHDLALDAATSVGAPGLLLLIAWIVLAVRVARGRAELAAGVLASGTASLFSAAVMPPLLLTLLLVGALISLETPDRSVEAASGGWIAVPVAVCAAVFACLLAVSDFDLARFASHPDAEDYDAMLGLPMALAPEDIYCSRTLANTCNGSADCWRSAVRAAGRGTTTADDPANAWYNLAQFTAAENDVFGTRRALERASQIAPKWFKPHWAMSELLKRTGDPETAELEARRASSLGFTGILQAQNTAGTPETDTGHR